MAINVTKNCQTRQEDEGKEVTGIVWIVVALEEGVCSDLGRSHFVERQVPREDTQESVYRYRE